MHKETIPWDRYREDSSTTMNEIFTPPMTAPEESHEVHLNDPQSMSTAASTIHADRFHEPLCSGESVIIR